MTTTLYNGKPHAGIAESPGNENLILPYIEQQSDGYANSQATYPRPARKVPRKNNGWALTEYAFNRLLELLDADRERAGLKYESIRRRLVKYFECRGCLQSEDCADETINRVARRIEEGLEVWPDNPAGYFYGVARFVLREYWCAPERWFPAIECLPAAAHPHQEENHAQVMELEVRLALLEQCLEALPCHSRELIIRYFKGKGSDRIERRKKLAEQLGIPLNALRIRVHRIKTIIERHLNEALDQARPELGRTDHPV